MELLYTVEGYEDFVNAMMFVSPVPIGFEDIPGDSKGYFHTEEKRIAIQEELSENDANKEAQLLYGNTDKYGIYQLKDNPELRQFRFEGTESLKRTGITKDNFDAIKMENYNLIYVGELSELQGPTQGETLEAVYEKFNIDHPADYKGHSLSVSDIGKMIHEIINTKLWEKQYLKDQETARKLTRNFLTMLQNLGMSNSEIKRMVYEKNVR